MNFILIKTLRYEPGNKLRSVENLHKHVSDVTHIKNKDEFNRLYPHELVHNHYLIWMVQANQKYKHYIVNLDLYNTEEYSNVFPRFQKLVDIAIEYTRDNKINTILSE